MGINKDMNISFGAISGLGDDMLSSNKAIQAILDNLDAGLKPFIGSWDGDSREAYQTAKTGWDGKMGDLNGNFLQLQQQVVVAGQSYQSNEAQNTNMMQDIV